MSRWPFVLRRTHEREVARLQGELRERQQHLSRLGHSVAETKREHAKLLSDLRLVRVHIDYPTLASDKIGFSFQMHGAVFDGYRHSVMFADLIGHMVEDSMWRTPEGRAVLAGYFRDDASEVPRDRRP